MRQREFFQHDIDFRLEGVMIVGAGANFLVSEEAQEGLEELLFVNPFLLSRVRQLLPGCRLSQISILNC